MKRFIAMCCALALWLAAVPLGIVVSAEDLVCGDYTYRVLADGTAQITAYNGSATALTVPSTLDGYTVTIIGEESFYGNTAIQSVVLPDSIKKIGGYAFYNCRSLREINLPAGLTVLSGVAFCNCSSLESVTIPGTVTLFDYGVFAGCSALEEVTLGVGLTTIGPSAFQGCTSLQSIVIPEGVTTIKSGAFNRCSALSEVSIPASVTTIEASAFYNCALYDIVLSDNVTTIGSAAFTGTAHYNDPANWEDDVLYIGRHLIEASESIRGSYTVKADTLAIADKAFGDCRELEHVTLHDGAVTIPEYLFYGCSSLRSVTLPAGLTTIGPCAFRGCKALTSFTVPASVQTVGSSAFNECTALRTVVLPESVSRIEYSAFYGCTALQSVCYRGDEAAWNQVVIQNANEALINAVRYDNVADVQTVDGVFYVIHEDTTATVMGYDGTKAAAVLSPMLNGCLVTAIGERAFADHTALQVLLLPDSVQTVGARAFDGSALSQVYYGGSAEQRYAMAIADGNKTLHSASWQFNAFPHFPDVKVEDWYYEAVSYVSMRGYMAGFATGHFGPAANMQRQDFVLILARILGADLNAYAGQNGGLRDVPKNAYYSAAVAWGVENGYVSGYNNGQFGVGDPITREQVCTILYRVVGSPEVTDVDGTLARFPDKNQISAFAKTPMAWAVQNGVMSGMASGKMAPVSKAARSHVAVIVMSMDKQGMFEGQ